MGKVKTIYRILVPVLVVLGMALSPFLAMETASASSVSNAWVELSDGTALNKTGVALEYIIHFTTTTALSGGKDTITVFFPNGTTDMAGEEGTDYDFTLPASILATNVAVDPDGALTTTITYTDCYTAPDVGTYRVRLTVPEDIAAGASPYIKFETGATITSAVQDKTEAGALCHYRIKVETSQDTTPVYSEYFYLGDADSCVTSVDALSGYPNPATVGTAAEYKFEFTVGASGALAIGSGTITVIFPSGTTVPASAGKNYVQVDADGSEGTYSLTACTVDPTCHSDSRTVTLTVPQSVANSANVYVYFASGFGLVNPTTSTSTARVKIYTSAEPEYAVAASTFYGVWGSDTDDVFAVGHYDDDTMRHYDGSNWSSMDSSTSDNLYAVWGTASDNVYAVGTSGAILKYVSSWAAKTSGTTNHLYGVWGYDGTHVYAVGASGTILYSGDGGTTWTAKTSGTTNHLYGIWGSAADDIYAVGASGTILHSTDGAGATWTAKTSGTTNHLYGVGGKSDGSHVHVVGASGTTLYSTDGDTWTAKTSGTTNHLYAVWENSDTSYAYAVGASGAILQYISSWSAMTNDDTNRLYGVWGTSDNNIYAVGYGGTILHYTDSWESVDSDTTNGYAVTADTATKLGFASVSGAYSDDATMINMYSSTIYLQLQDQYGNIKAPASDVTASLNSTSSTGRFYSAAASQISSATIYDGTGDPEGITAGQFSLLYKDTVAGTYTITATAGSYTQAIWTITVAPAVALYDTSDELVNTYSPTSTAPVAESGTANSGDYVQNAVYDALPGETVKLGDGIYELDTALTISKAITLQSVNGASSTTLRPTTALAQVVTISATGSATYGVTIDGITFDRLRSGTHFTDGIYDSSADYITIQNCVFSYIYNQGIVLTSTSVAFTEGTISNNTFTNGGGSDVADTDAAIDVRVASDHAISGITISGNTITSQKGKGIYLAGQDATYTVSSVTITGNTITKATSYGIQGNTNTATFAITSNTITGCYGDGIDVQGTAYTVKKNVVTDNLGDGIDVELTSASHLINYNDIYDNTGYGVNVRSSVTTVDTKYNWWGDASGPTYTAATGASVTVSNAEGIGENITDRVTYYEWLYQPIADVIADNAAYYSRAVNLNVGWNTLSAPIILDDSTDTVGEVVDSAKITIAYWYDAGDADTDDNYWEQVTSDYELEPCGAIYIKMNATDSVLLKYNATDISLPTKQLYAGWNLIGLASLETKHVDDAVQSVANTPTNLPGYSQVISPSMNSEDWTYSYGQSYTDEDMLVGEGYWIYMQNDCTLVGFTVTPIEPSLD
jgi:photosystem II stability/assembly factor-like uncharacterized protein